MYKITQTTLIVLCILPYEHLTLQLLIQVCAVQKSAAINNNENYYVCHHCMYRMSLDAVSINSDDTSLALNSLGKDGYMYDSELLVNN